MARLSRIPVDTGEVVENASGAADMPSQESLSVKKDLGKEFSDRDGVRCRSITPGVLVMHGVKTNIDYTWDQDGLSTEVEYQDLVAAVRTHSAYVYGPYIIIEDKDFLAKFQDVEKLYEGMYSTKDLRDILSLPVGKMKAEIEKLPEGARKSILTLASTEMKKGKLDSLSKIRAINSIFGVDLMLLSDTSH